MDVLLIDDKEGEGALLHGEWDTLGVTTVHLRDLKSVLELVRPVIPERRFDAVVIDLDLGRTSSWTAGGLQTVAEISRWRQRTWQTFDIVLRTQDVDDDRSLAAVLAAEIHGGALPLWGKSREDSHHLLRYLSADADSRGELRQYGGMAIHPVRLVRGERGERLLGEYLFEGRRGQVWALVQQEFDADIALLYAGFAKRNKFWDGVNGLFSAIVHLRGMDRHLHQLDGDVIRLNDIERDIAQDELKEVEIAIGAVVSGPGSVAAGSNIILRLLEARRLELSSWLEGQRKRKPTFNRNYDQGEFLGVFGRVLGDEAVVELFTPRITGV